MPECGGKQPWDLLLVMFKNCKNRVRINLVLQSCKIKRSNAREKQQGWGRFFCWIFFVKIFNNNNFRKYIKPIFIFSLIIVSGLTILNKFNNPNFKIAAISNLGFTLYCLIFFIGLFKNNPVKKITDVPVFWIITGLF